MHAKRRPHRCAVGFAQALRAADRSVTRQLAEARGEHLPAKPTMSTGDEPCRL